MYNVVPSTGTPHICAECDGEGVVVGWCDYCNSTGQIRCGSCMEATENCSECKMMGCAKCLGQCSDKGCVEGLVDCGICKSGVSEEQCCKCEGTGIVRNMDTTYQVVTSSKLSDFIAQVSRKRAAGWSLQGGIFVVTGNNNYVRYYQAIYYDNNTGGLAEGSERWR